MPHSYSAILPSPLGKIGVTTKEKKLTALKLLPPNAELKPANDPFTHHVEKQLAAYFANGQHKFDVALQLAGTPFQQKVWGALSTLSNGSVLSYGELAKKLQTGPRAIGQACRTNPILLIVPCHRIVAVNHLGGYSGKQSGKWLETKKWLLNHEGYSF